MEASPAPTPSRAVYGFVMWLLAHLALLLYLVWALVPDTYLELAGLEFLPQKYWAVALPLYLSVCFFLFVFVIYPCLGMLITPGPGDLRHVTDTHSHTVSRPQMFSGGPGVPPLYDESPERVLELLRSRDSIR
jgi:phosphatidylinositol glycan class P protein